MAYYDGAEQAFYGGVDGGGMLGDAFRKVTGKATDVLHSLERSGKLGKGRQEARVTDDIKKDWDKTAKQITGGGCGCSAGGSMDGGGRRRKRSVSRKRKTTMSKTRRPKSMSRTRRPKSKSKSKSKTRSTSTSSKKKPARVFYATGRYL